MLEEAYPNDIVKSLGGVVPDTEIRTASVDDSQQSFNEYIQDATKRAEHDQRFQNEPRQVKPGEDVPHTVALLVEILEEAGIPKGVVNLVHGYGAEVGAHIVSHPDIPLVSFTGVVPVGR